MAKLEDAVRRAFNSRLSRKTKTDWGGPICFLGLVCIATGVLLMVFASVFSYTLYLTWIGIALLFIGGHWPDVKEDQTSFSLWRRMQLLSMAKRMEEGTSISGSDYGKFLVLLERATKGRTMSYGAQDHVVRVLEDLILQKGRRISGLDYVELEKELLGVGTLKVSDKRVEILPESRRHKILSDYEKLREEIRDWTLRGAAGEGGLNVQSK